MAVIHRAYTIDAQAFHRELEAKLIDHDRLRLDMLHDLAVAAAALPDDPVQELLEGLRFDPEMLETPADEDVSYTSMWYMLILAGKAVPAPSLSHRCQVSHVVMQTVLPLLGWSNEELRLLLYGDCLHRFLEVFAHPLLVKELGIVDQYGGWLSIEQAAGLLSHLLLVEDLFASPLAETVQYIQNLAGWWGRSSSAELLSQAYADVREMLETALSRDQPLYLLLDF